LIIRDWVFKTDAKINESIVYVIYSGYDEFLVGENRIIQKVGEEAIETVIAAKNRDKEEIINEVSDLFFHLFVMLVNQGVTLDEVVKNLEGRHKKT
jgi:phosphoribosyl-AMP cyclohydrolase / phosphoribosyl-ATP pyrophosphohydrolase